MSQFFELFWVFFKIGTFTFGGGYAMIPLIKEQLVDQREWINEDDFIDTLAIAQSSPGPIAVNTAVFLGLKVQGFWGMVAATLGSVLPSFIILLLIAFLFQGIQNNPYFIAAFKGIKPAVVALILSPVITLAKSSKYTGYKFILPVIIACLVAYANISPILFIILAMVFGNLYYGRVKA